jgi:hypothetical protein
MEGWIKLYRKITENPLYFSEPFTRAQAWIDLLLIANSKDGYFFKRGIKVDVKRGQVGYDLDTLSKRWKWSRGKAERFISVLENDNQIVRQKNNITTLISITNYEVYQESSKANNKTSSKANGHQIVKQTETNKNDKNDKKEKNIIISWKNDFQIYLQNLRNEWKKIVTSEYIKERETYHKNLDIKLTLEKACKDFWATDEGWKHKKKSKSESINWKLTFNNSLTQKVNQVYKNDKKEYVKPIKLIE